MLRSFFRHRWRNLDDVHTFVLFVGYPRSGHTVLGAILNAHPDAVISHELHPLRNVERGETERQIINAILDRDGWWRDRGWQWEGWDYRIPGQWQGRYRSLEVVGDKSGGRTARHIFEHPHALADLMRRLTSTRLRMIHHVRNPFDTIATMYRKGQPGVATLDDAIQRYPDHCEGVRIALAEAEVLTIQHESLIENPRDTIERLCGFVGVEATAEYAAACAGRVHASPRRSRDLIEWTPEQIARVEAIVRRYPFLTSYAFDDRA